MGFKYNEFKTFVENYENINKQFDTFLNNFLLKNALEALANTKRNTPVDTGDLRANWFIGNIYRDGANLVVDLYNNKDYASYVEYGHLTRNRENWVDGYFMSTIAIDEIEKKIPKRFNSEFKKFMKQLGGY